MSKEDSIIGCKECYQKHLKWDECSGFSWYSPNDIFYCRYQVMWLLCRENYPSLNSGEWIPVPEYIDRVQKSRSMTVTYERTMDVIGELNKRLKNSGVVHLNWFIDAVSPIGVEAGIDFNWEEAYKKLESETRRMINYLSGNWRKVDSYSDWKAKLEYKNRQKLDRIHR